MTEEHRYLRDRLQVAAESLVILVTIAIGTGFFLGLTANIASAYLVSKSPRWPWLAGSAVFSLALPLSVVWRVYSRGYSVQTVFQVLVPFRVTASEAEILIAPPYPVTRTLHQSFAWILNDEANKSAFLSDWHEALRDGKQPFKDMPARCARDVSVYAVLDALREYADQTFTVKWFFTEQTWKANKLESLKIPNTNWPVPIKENLCFRDEAKPAFRVLRIPQGLTLEASEITAEGDLARTEITLKSRYGKLTFAVAHYPSKTSARSREGSIMNKYCAIDKDEEVWLAKFHVRLAADFGGLRIFGRQFRRDFLPWIEGLFEHVREELDWQLCLERDPERMLVGLTHRVDALLGALAQQSKDERRAAVPSGK
jgi:hypothetical protein